MANKQLKIKRARQNIKLLEEADHDAINKVNEPRFKKILTAQERQLHHYLAQYLDPNYLPAGITKEYEFPKYFYYTVNSKKNGVVQRRTRTDSAMFKRFMKNKTRREEANAQGIFKITDKPIKIKIDMAPAYPKKKKATSEDYKSLLGNVNFGDFEDKKPDKKKYTAESIYELIEPRDDDQWLLDLLEDIAKYEEPKKRKKEIKAIKQTINYEGNKPSKSKLMDKQIDEVFLKKIIEEILEEAKPKKKINALDDILDTTNRYTILGVAPNATIADIKKAYKKLALKYHPDKTGGDKELTRRFIIIDDAYKSLLAELTARESRHITLADFPKPKKITIDEEIAQREAEIVILETKLSNAPNMVAKHRIMSEIKRLKDTIKMLKQIHENEK